jgi:hypothetical protein
VVQAAKRVELALHTVRGFVAELKKRWNTTVLKAKRSRLPGPINEAAKGGDTTGSTRPLPLGRHSCWYSARVCHAPRLVSEVECFGNSLPR